ncbi:MAG: glycosyltransferase [Ignavibacteria bacterium]|nr:glycosyltransferase [Ignavibacteria bacterium]
MHTPLTLIIAVYNRPDALRFILAACARQTVGGFEVIVADDGSGPAVRAAVDEARASPRFTLTHVWQEDRGWRKNRILNEAVRRARSPYLVFIDGDCLPHRRFLADHYEGRQSATVLCGRRVETSPAWTSRLTLDMVRSGAYESLGIREVWEGLRGRALRLEDGIRLSRSEASALHGPSRGPARAPGILGSNFSVHTRDLLSINGFDETYDGPGSGEDSDVQFRLALQGVRSAALRHRAIQYHLWHPRTAASERSERRFEDVRARGRAWCEQGLLPSAASAPAEAAC